MDGLRCTTGIDKITVRLLGSLVNLLPDLNLPEPAKAWFDLRQRGLDHRMAILPDRNASRDGTFKDDWRCEAVRFQ